MRVSQGFWGTREHWKNIEGNKGTLANFWEQGNKIRKITVRKHSENEWEHGNIGQFWKPGNKGTRTPPWETLNNSKMYGNEPRYNEALCNEDPGLTKDILQPNNSKVYGKGH